jgi:PHS family inorganic phosphate transporter-like MFS transporter
LAAVYFRTKLPETPRFTLHVEGNASQAANVVKSLVENQGEKIADNEPEPKPKFSWYEFRHHFSQWKNLKVLIGCSLCWFLLDIAFYGLQLNQSDVLKVRSELIIDLFSQLDSFL